MEKKIKKTDNERPKERINQFIIECLFNKYFEENGQETVVVKRKEIALSGLPD